ncbi:MAG: peptidoglycan D,D-transpeptidase FtsI family protein [Planctomycetota bacterium]
MKSVRIIVVLLLLLMVVFLSLGVRCFYLQFYKSEHYKAISLKQQQILVSEQPQRGVILDSRGVVVAASDKNKKNIFADPSIIDDPKEVSEKLQPILDMGAHKICQLIVESSSPKYAKLISDADAEMCSAARKVHHGIGVESVWERHYPAGRLLSTIVGFTSIDNIGLAGIEFQYDKEFRGSAGHSIFLADALPYRRPLRLEAIGSKVADGYGIILTIDSTIQQFAREELMKVWKSFEAESAVAIVAEPETGAILAMVSLPDFDPASFNTEDPSNFRNRAINDTYEPGSVMKPIVAAIALDDGVINRNEKIYCEEGSYVGKGFGRIGEYGNHRFGNLNVKGILVNSSNIGMSKIGQRMGKEKLYRGMKLFGFGKRTGIDLPGEGEGLLWPVSKWTGYSVTRIPFGQEISVTAIQLLRAFCILANGGKAIRPFVVRAIVDDEGEVIKFNQSKYDSVGYIVSSKTAHWIVREALVGVVEDGTGKRAALQRWQVFGKTGTANIAKSDSKGYSERAYVASFVGGAPAEKPAVVVLVSVRKPNIRLGKGYTGGTVASPVVGKILEKTLNYLD